MQIVVRLQINKAATSDDVEWFVDFHLDHVVRDLMESWTVERAAVEKVDEDLAPVGWETMV